MAEIYQKHTAGNIHADSKPKTLPRFNFSFPKNALAAFLVKPDNIHFETQETNEEILLLMRAHPVVTVGWILITLVLIGVPIFITPLLFGGSTLPKIMPWGYFIILPMIWYLGVFAYAFTNFLHWYFNIYIVTNKRVVDIDWVNLLYKHFSSTQLAKIQDVSYKQGGVLDSFFDFGTVIVQTAGNEANFEFDEVPKPEKIVRQINALLEQHKNVKGESV